MNEDVVAWWFAASDRLPHGDGRLVTIGETHSLDGEIVLCKNALHASRHPFDALGYAPGPYLYKVRCGGTIVGNGGKLGCSERTYLAMRDATATLRAFARGEALSVIHLWDAPGVVRQYLETGDEEIRAAAWAAARATAGAAAGPAAWAAAGAAAWAAAGAAAWAAARAAARATAGAAAWAAARAASRQRFADAIAALFAEPA